MLDLRSSSMSASAVSASAADKLNRERIEREYFRRDDSSNVSLSSSVTNKVEADVAAVDDEVLWFVDTEGNW
jgi:hypothetical protein